MNRFVHFELVSEDLEKTAQFYRDVFGWDIQKWEGPVDYWLVTSGDASTPGINGGLTQAGGPFMAGATVNTVEVDDIDAVLEKAVAHGAEIVFPKDVIPGVGYQAYIRDTTGVIVGLHQALEGAGM